MAQCLPFLSYKYLNDIVHLTDQKRRDILINIQVTLRRLKMMDNPFFGSHWSQLSRSRPSRSVSGMPVQRKDTTTKTSSSPKFIPIHFVRSETTRSGAALKIQKVYRGFVVRKSVKRIASIRRQVEEVERRISQNETVELIRRDAKERLRLNEALMALLFKLDSVRGVDSAVRDCRKAVIKKAIALQERVDDIAAGNPIVSPNEGNDDDSSSLAQVVEQTLEIKESSEQQTIIREDVADQTIVQVDEAPNAGDVAYLSENAVGESGVYCFDGPAQHSCEMEATDYTVDDRFVVVESAPEVCDKMDIAEVGVDSVMKADEEGCVVKQIIQDLPAGERLEESVETSPSVVSACPKSFSELGDENTSERELREEDRMKAQGVERTEWKLEDSEGVGERDDHKRNTQLLEKMMEDNEKMMSLMQQLFERNEMQTQLLSSLTQRVEQLERAFICDRLRRKKKRPTV